MDVMETVWAPNTMPQRMLGGRRLVSDAPFNRKAASQPSPEPSLCKRAWDLMFTYVRQTSGELQQSVVMGHLRAMKYEGNF